MPLGGLLSGPGPDGMSSCLLGSSDGSGRPSNGQLMHIACLWSRWTKPGEPDLLSFAAITDEPPREIEAAGHDRCIIPIKPENIEAWLKPEASSLDAMYAILDDKDRPYYEHRLAA